MDDYEEDDSQGEFDAERVSVKRESGDTFSLVGSPVAAQFFWCRDRVTYIQGAFGTG